MAMKSKAPVKSSVRNSGKHLKQPSAPRDSYLIGFIQNEWFLAFFFLAVTFACYLPVLHADFIPTWDDNAYIVDNPLIKSLSFPAIREMFTSQVGGTYVPLPLLSFAIEYKLWGLNPLPFHATNLVLHLLCTYLVFRILYSLKITTIYAAAAALIYGVHPMGAESVAWVTERKDLLYCVFYFGSLLLYILYVQAGPHRKILFAASLFLFILALFSKIQAVSLPLVLFLVDYYFDRKSWIKQVFEKVPFLLLSLVFGVAGIFVLKSVGALKINELYTLSERMLFGIYTLSAYLLKFVAPVTLSAFYPYPVTTGHALPVIYYLSPLFIILAGFLVYRSGRNNRAVLFGALFFLFSVFFMLQIFGAGAGFLADRYVKVPYLGLVFLVGWGMAYSNEKYKGMRPVVWGAFFVFNLYLMVLTYQRCNVWQNGGTLWSDVIDKYPGKDARPYSCRGVYYRTEKDNDKALADMNSSLAIDRSDPEIMLMRGNIYFDKGKDDSAYADYMRIIRKKTDNSLALGNLGAIYVRRNQPDSAVYYLSMSLHLDSSIATTFANRAVAYGALGKPDESISDFKRYLSLEPNDERVFMSIAMQYQKSGRYKESLGWFDKAIARKPNFGNYYFFRSQSFKFTGNRERALADGLKARELGVELPPGYIQSLQ
jgi:protein O-mannosyl-transferase